MLHSVYDVGLPWPDHTAATGYRPPEEIIGMADQQYLIRKGRPADEPKHGSTRRKLRDRESQRWLDSGDRIGPAPGGDEFAGSAWPTGRRTSMSTWSNAGRTATGSSSA